MCSSDLLTKHYGDKRAVDDLSFVVKPGIVTGFLGPNGSGKSTTMRLILGLDRPTSGSVTVNGKAYRDLPAPLHEVGAREERRIPLQRRMEEDLVAGPAPHLEDVGVVEAHPGRLEGEARSRPLGAHPDLDRLVRLDVEQQPVALRGVGP